VLYMIDVAVIASIPYLRRLSAAGTIDMALTHLVLAQPTYAGFFQARARAGVSVVLDNSAYELQDTTGAGMAAAPVLQAAALTGAQLVVCQDVLFDGPATLLTTQRFLDAARHHHSAGAAGWRFIGVPQGRTRAEWLDCYHRLVATPGIDMIGLSKLSVPRCFGAPVAEARIACVAHLLELGAPMPFHLLGGDRSLPWELREHRRRGHDRAEHGGVRSNDSSFAFWYAASGIDVDGHTGRAERAATTKPDLVAAALTDTDLVTALRHVALLRDAAGLPACGPDAHNAPAGPGPLDQEGPPCH
ncbi:MAG: hypothetical protein ACRDTF_16995, partial [Pseudonocardiaceae bacterium]